MPQHGHELWWDGAGKGKEKRLCEEAMGELTPESGKKESQASGESVPCARPHPILAGSTYNVTSPDDGWGRRVGSCPVP